jgi:hypothetical protein
MDPTARQHAGTEVEWLRKRARQLEIENRELRRELDELRRGVGISVLIQGRLVPLSALPSPGVALSSYPTPAPFAATGQQNGAVTFTPPPMWSERPSQPVPPAPPSLPYPPAPAPRRAPQSPPRGANPRSEPFPEEAWITGQRRAVRPPAPQPQLQPQPPASQQHAAHPSQRITPGWLREEPPMPAHTPAPAGPVSRVGADQPSPTPTPAPRARNDARPIARPNVPERGRSRLAVPRLEPAHIPSLAEITGHMPAVRAPGKGPRPERNPFKDSYVLD